MAKGWRNESARHSMARRGIKTAQKVNKLPVNIRKKHINPEDIDTDKVIDQMSITKNEKELLKMLGLTYYQSQNMWSANKIGRLNADTHLSRYYNISKPRARKIIMDLLNTLENKGNIEKGFDVQFIGKAELGNTFGYGNPRTGESTLVTEQDLRKVLPQSEINEIKKNKGKLIRVMG